jgi:hypothetical protein
MFSTPTRKTGAFAPRPQNVRKQRESSVLPSSKELEETKVLWINPHGFTTPVRQAPVTEVSQASREENELLAYMGRMAAQAVIEKNKNNNPQLYTRNNSNKFKTPSRQIRQRKSRKIRKNRK